MPLDGASMPFAEGRGVLGVEALLPQTSEQGCRQVRVILDQEILDARLRPVGAPAYSGRTENGKVPRIAWPSALAVRHAME